jgi:CCR4-NOT transcriptional regulation complex NOT5 subunit
MQSFEITQKRASTVPSQSAQRMLVASHADFPSAIDAEQPRYYKPKYRFNTPSHYPQEPLPIFDDPRLFTRVDPDTLFYVFYYKQGTYQQYLAAKSLKDQSWRFHKQYQTWFQRHEEPKTITEEFEQGTYRFFDYESTWYVAHMSSPSHTWPNFPFVPPFTHHVRSLNLVICFLVLASVHSILHPNRRPEKDHAYKTYDNRMNRRKADFKFAYKFLEDDV